jgi:hypothetical protein
MQKIITGQPKYIGKKLDAMKKEGYVVKKSHTFPDGSMVYTMEFPEEKMSYSNPSITNKNPPQVEKSGGAIKKRSKSTKHTW